MKDGDDDDNDCDEWRHIFTRIDSYFRDDIVLEGTIHASAKVRKALHHLET